MIFYYELSFFLILIIFSFVGLCWSANGDCGFKKYKKNEVVNILILYILVIMLAFSGYFYFGNYKSFRDYDLYLTKLGAIHYKNQMFKEAMVDYNKSQELGKISPQKLIGFVLSQFAYNRQNKFSLQQIEKLTKAANMDREAKIPMLVLAQAYAQNCDYEKAYNIIKNYLKNHINNTLDDQLYKLLEKYKNKIVKHEP